MLRRLAAALAALACFLCAPALAAEPQGIARWTEAADRFEALAQEAWARGEVLRSGDPETAALLRTLGDTEALFAAPAERMASSLVVTRRFDGITEHYLLFRAPATEPDRSHAYFRNLQIYQDEVMPLLSATIDGMGALITALEDPEARHSLNAVAARAPIIRALSGYTNMLTMNGLKREHRLRLAQSLARSAPALAQVLTLPERSDLLSEARSIRTRAGSAARPYLDEIVAALADPVCVGLCAM